MLIRRLQWQTLTCTSCDPPSTRQCGRSRCSGTCQVRHAPPRKMRHFSVKTAKPDFRSPDAKIAASQSRITDSMRWLVASQHIGDEMGGEHEGPVPDFKTLWLARYDDSMPQIAVTWRCTATGSHPGCRSAGVHAARSWQCPAAVRPASELSGAKCLKPRFLKRQKGTCFRSS